MIQIRLISAVILTSLLFSACTNKQSPLPSPQPTKEATMVSKSPSMHHHMMVSGEKDFLNQMIPHHQEAINTSEILLKQTTDQELKKFAQDVIAVQTSEITQMKQWLKDGYQYEYTTNTAYVPMMGDLTALKGTELEKAYIQGMIGHHQGAIEMAKQVLTFHPKPEVKNMVDEIISVQSAEVKTLQEWLRSKYETQ
jgi:uncharacterized protein (DUF305 family)